MFITAFFVHFSYFEIRSNLVLKRLVLLITIIILFILILIILVKRLLSSVKSLRTKPNRVLRPVSITCKL